MAAALALPVLLAVAACLLALAALAQVMAVRWLGPAMAGLCAVALLAAGWAALQGGVAVLPGGVALDPLGAFAALAVALAGLAAGLGGAAGVVAGMAGGGLLLAVADGATVVVLGAGLVVLLSGGMRRPAVAGLVMLGGGMALLGTGGFELVRAAPPEGWRAALVLLLVLAGAAALVPMRRGFAAGPALVAYLVARVLLDVSGRATPEVWGLPPLLVGAGLALGGALLAASGPASFEALLGAVAWQQAGWMLAGLGAAALARAADLLPLASLAAGGALLQALAVTACLALGRLAAGAAERGAGSRALERLGGLARSMRRTSLVMAVALGGLALLPPGAGFAGGWMVLQAVFAAARLGGLPLQLAVAASVLMLGASAGIGVLALVRVGGVALLGRPRTPRAAAAEDPRGLEWAVLAGMAALCLGLGLVPGLALRLAGPAQALLTTGGLDGAAGWVGLHAQAEAPGYQPLVLVAIVAVVLGVLAVLSRTGRLRAGEAAAPWEGGFAPPPVWMPFGDPATQVDAASFALELPRVRPFGLLPRVRVAWPALAWRPGYAAAALLAALVAVLLACVPP